MLNRLDEIVVFDPLSHDQLKKVSRLQIKYVAIRIAERGVAFAVTDAALDIFLLEAYDPVSKIVTLFDLFVIKNLSCQGMCLRPVAVATVFLNFLKFWSPAHDLALSSIVWILEPRALILDGFLKITFHPGFQKLLMFGIVVDHRF